jgi:hypothetical protein
MERSSCSRLHNLSQVDSKEEVNSHYIFILIVLLPSKEEVSSHHSIIH